MVMTITLLIMENVCIAWFSHKKKKKTSTEFGTFKKPEFMSDSFFSSCVRKSLSLAEPQFQLLKARLLRALCLYQNQGGAIKESILQTLSKVLPSYKVLLLSLLLFQLFGQGSLHFVLPLPSAL